MKEYKRRLAFFCAFTLLFSYSLMSFAADGDVSAASADNEIPNLFRQNGVYSNAENTPLVIKDGVEYVPISVFSLYPYVDVEYSKVDDNFFLVNTKNNHYISFNTEQELASTHDGDLLTMPIEVFNQTRYIPAKTVGVVLGFTCETYNKDGVVAFRVSDGKTGQTLNDMMQEYLEKETPNQEETVKPDTTVPEKEYVGNEIFKNGDTGNLIFPEVPPNSSDGKNNGGGEIKEPDDKNNDNKPEVQPEKEDPIKELAERRVGLCFKGISYSGTEKIADTLDARRIKASFVVSKDDILTNPALVRELSTSGHSLILTASATGSTATEYADSFIAELEATNEALKLVLKKKTRMCVFPDDMPQEIREDEDFLQKIAQAGYLVFTSNFDSGDGPQFKGSAYTISANIKKQITEGFDKDEMGVVTSVLTCSDKTYYYLLDIAVFVGEYSRMNFFRIDEAFLYNN